MKKSRFTDKQIFEILQEQESGQSATDLCRRHGISSATLNNWKSKYGGITISGLKKRRLLEQENARLKRIIANQQVDIAILKEAESIIGKIERS